MNQKQYTCPVCGYQKLNKNPYANMPEASQTREAQYHPPYYKIWGTPSGETCPCCGSVFEVAQYEKDEHEFSEKLWIWSITDYFEWKDESLKPDIWDPLQQLRHAGLPFDKEIALNWEVANGKRFTCPVCGYPELMFKPYENMPDHPPYVEPPQPYSEHWGKPYFMECDCCRFNFSLQKISFEEGRIRWLTNYCGRNWGFVYKPDPDFNWRTNMESAGIKILPEYEAIMAAHPPDERHTCPVCGFNMLLRSPYAFMPAMSETRKVDPPYCRHWQMPSYEVCPCCGFEFGNDDDPGMGSTGLSFDEHLKMNIETIVRFTYEGDRPDDYNLVKQMRAAGINVELYVLQAQKAYEQKMKDENKK